MIWAASENFKLLLKSTISLSHKFYVINRNWSWTCFLWSLTWMWKCDIVDINITVESPSSDNNIITICRDQPSMTRDTCPGKQTPDTSITSCRLWADLYNDCGRKVRALFQWIIIQDRVITRNIKCFETNKVGPAPLRIRSRAFSPSSE